MTLTDFCEYARRQALADEDTVREFGYDVLVLGSVPSEMPRARWDACFRAWLAVAIRRPA